MEGFVSVQSSFSPAETAARLESEIKANKMTIFARVNHGALAAEVGLELRLLCRKVS